MPSWLALHRTSCLQGDWSEQEDALLLQMHQQCGSNWSRIAKALKVRIPHQCRSRFNVLTRNGAVKQQQQQQQKRQRQGGAAQCTTAGTTRLKKPKRVSAPKQSN